jgi:hypothetical protein
MPGRLCPAAAVLEVLAALFVAFVAGFPGGLWGWVSVHEFLSGVREDWKPGVIVGAVAPTVAGEAWLADMDSNHD